MVLYHIGPYKLVANGDQFAVIAHMKPVLIFPSVEAGVKYIDAQIDAIEAKRRIAILESTDQLE